MKQTLLFIAICFTFLACDLNKYTKVFIDNQNAFPIDVTIQTNNVRTVFKVPANSTLDTLRNFTDIVFEDGKWLVNIRNTQNGQSKDYEHGQFYKGELSNNFSIKTKGSYVAFSVDN